VEDAKLIKDLEARVAENTKRIAKGDLAPAEVESLKSKNERLIKSITEMRKLAKNEWDEIVKVVDDDAEYETQVHGRQAIRRLLIEARETEKRLADLTAAQGELARKLATATDLIGDLFRRPAVNMPPNPSHPAARGPFGVKIDWAVSVPCVLAAALSFIAMGTLPIEFYDFARWAVFLTAGWSTFSLFRQHKGRPFPQKAVLAFIPVLVALAILFNPINPFTFHREAWHTLDAMAGAWLLATAMAVSMLSSPDQALETPKPPG
jgi:hypothetical protein